MTSAPRVPPPLPLVLRYTQWDHHFLQWLPSHPRYEAVEVLAKERPGGNVVWFFLTDRDAPAGSKHQTHYVDDPRLARMLGTGDSEVHEAEIRYQRAEAAGGCRMRVELETRDGPVAWSFDAGGQPTRRALLVDNAAAAHNPRGGFLAFYLEDSALSAPSSALVVDGRPYVVEPWPELSRPPHFVAYGGIYSRPVHVAYVPTHDRTVRAFAEGRVLPASAAAGLGAEAVFGWGDVEQHTRVSGEAFETEALVVRDGAASLMLRFTPPLPDLRFLPEGSTRSAWAFALGEQAEVSGEIDLEKQGAAVTVRFRPQSPIWAQRIEVVSRVELLEDGYAAETRTVF